jgi:hypothetical protein
MTKNGKHLKILYEVFNAKGYVDCEFDENFQIIYNEIGIGVSPNTNPMEIILNHIYLHDNISLLDRMLGTEETDNVIVFDYDIDYCFTEFERGDWSDYPDTDYGEEGHNYYEIHTKNYIHTFSHMMPFREHFTLCRSDKKNKI